jgi:hypothetical protein
MTELLTGNTRVTTRIIPFASHGMLEVRRIGDAGSGEPSRRVFSPPLQTGSWVRPSVGSAFAVRFRRVSANSDWT